MPPRPVKTVTESLRRSPRKRKEIEEREETSRHLKVMDSEPEGQNSSLSSIQNLQSNQGSKELSALPAPQVSDNNVQIIEEEENECGQRHVFNSEERSLLSNSGRKQPGLFNERKTWILQTIYSSVINEQINKLCTESNENNIISKKLIDLLLTAEVMKNEESSKVTDVISKENLEPFVCKISEKSLDKEAYLLVKLFDELLTCGNENVWKIVLNGSITPAVMYTLNVGDTVVFYGAVLDVTNKMVILEWENSENDIYIISHSSKGNNHPENTNLEEFSRTSFIYDSCETVTIVKRIFKFFSVAQTVVIIRPDESTLSCGEICLQGEHLQQQLPSEPSQFHTLQSHPENNIQQCSTDDLINMLDENVNANSTNNPTERDIDEIDENEVTIRPVRDSLGSHQNLNDDQAQWTNPEDIVRMSYDDWIATGNFIAGSERPKLIKTKNYKYQTLQELDNELKKEIRTEYGEHSKPSMILKSQRFTYGFVVSIEPSGLVESNAYHVRISDETKENVLLRIHASKQNKKKGPTIMVGQVIRVHRMTVQVEFDSILDAQKMVLSTSPHWNYTIFYFDSDSRCIVYNSCAKTLTIGDEDKKRTFNLLKYFRDHQNPPDLNSTTDIRNSQRDNHSNQERAEASPHSSLNSSRGVEEGEQVFETSTPRKTLNNRDEDSQSVSSYRRRSSPKFHRSPPPSPI